MSLIVVPPFGADMSTISELVQTTRTASLSQTLAVASRHGKRTWVRRNVKSELKWPDTPKRYMPDWHFGHWRRWKEGAQAALVDQGYEDETKRLLREAIAEMDRFDVEDVVPGLAENLGSVYIGPGDIRRADEDDEDQAED